MDVVKIMVVDWITFSLIVLCIMASVSLLLGVLLVAMVITREVSGLRQIRMMNAVQKMLVWVDGATLQLVVVDYQMERIKIMHGTQRCHPILA